jgi:prevent-host-death family protein
MAYVNIRELRNHGGDVVERAARGEQITITHSGKPVAELHPVASVPLPAEVLLRRWRGLPAVDPVALRTDVDRVLDATL